MDRKIHEWEVSDEHGWRSVELWRSDGDWDSQELYLVAYDQDGAEVSPNV